MRASAEGRCVSPRTEVTSHRHDSQGGEGRRLPRHGGHGISERRGWEVPPTTLAFFSAFVCLTQRSCVRGSTVEMALESESLLLLHVAPCSFRPEGGVSPSARDGVALPCGARGPPRPARAPGHPTSLNAFGSDTRGWAHPLTRDPKAAGVERGVLRSGDVDLQAQLLQRPAVCLGHVLPRGRDVRLGHEQATQTHVDVLWGGGAPVRSTPLRPPGSDLASACPPSCCCPSPGPLSSLSPPSAPWRRQMPLPVRCSAAA